MRVNLYVHTSFAEDGGQTYFEVKAYVHDQTGLIGAATLYDNIEFAQQPDEEMNLNLWATAILRGLVARMEDTFVYVDQRPQAVLIQDAIERYKDLRVAYRLNLQ